jgi:sulfite reductase (NADPH) hemoprotein beta-component
VFDVTPYAEALTRYFLRHPLSSSLPRKFKIAFEGCSVDHALPASTTSAGSRRRATATAGASGVPGRRRRRHGDDDAGRRALVRVPAGGQMLDAAEAILRVFHAWATTSTSTRTG